MEARPLVSVAGCFLIYLAIGTPLTFGNITPYLTSYLRQKVEKDTTYEETTWIFYTFISTFSLLYFGGKLGSVIGRRWTMIIGSLIFSFGLVLTHWSIQHSLEATIITYGLIVSLGYVCCFVHPVVTAVEWFPNNKGLVTGIVASGSALTPLFMNNVQTFFVNPSNFQSASDGFFYNNEIIESVPLLFLVMGSVAGGILLTGLLMYKELPRESNQEKTITSKQSSVYKTSRQSCSKELSGAVTKDLDCRTTMNNDNLCEQDLANKNAGNEQLYSDVEVELHVSPIEALKMKEFYILSLVCICSIHPFMFVNIVYKTYGQTFISDDTFLSLTGSVAGVVHTVSRVTVGLIQDKISYKLTILLLLGMRTVLLFTLVVTPYGGQVMYMIWICGLFATFPLIPVCIPAAVVKVFGTKSTAEITGILLFASAASVFLWPLVLHRITFILGWYVMICVTATVAFVGLLIAILLPETSRTQPISNSFNRDKERTHYRSVEY
ncbi:apicoplast pyruvate carrier 1-like isoform X1 [Tachypleus tridentatus]|uniref:apicoplast pyruvate carrier 1-like isoform X1 n=1 Tax=Tachypleus tridentatus TaxID=6853 RepID=UPI003FCFF940